MTGISGPHQTAFITSKAQIEQFGKEIIKEDIDTTFWHMPISKEDKVYAIAIHNTKHVIKLIEKSNIFAINFIGLDMADKVKKCSTIHGEHIDKIKELDLICYEGPHTEAPILKTACAVLECHVIETKKFTDYTLFIAKIINSIKEYDSKRLFYLGNNNFTTTKQ